MTDWRSFPTRTIPLGTLLFRIHREHHGPAWFNTSGLFRFDPLPGDRDRFGVCYLATAELGAFLEVFGRIGAVPRDNVDERRISSLCLDRALDVANLTDRSALGRFGVDASHSTGTDYAPTQELAGELFDAGHAGILYRARSDPGMVLESIALFGEPGERSDAFATIKTGTISPDLLAQARDQFEIEVLPSSPLF